MYEDNSDSFSLSDSSSPTPSSEAEGLSASLNVFFRASAALASRIKGSQRQPLVTRSISDPADSELKKLLLQKTIASSHKLSSASSSSFKKTTSSKQHRSKKRFLMELHERLGVADRVASFEKSHGTPLSLEIEKNAALSSSLGQLTKFVNGIGSRRKQRPFIKALHEVLLKDPVSEPISAPDFDDRFDCNPGNSFDDWCSPDESVANSDNSSNDYEFSFLTWPGDSPYPNASFDGSDYGSCGTRMTSPSEFSDISAADDDVFGNIPLQPMDFALTDEEMQSLRASLSDSNETDLDFLTTFSYF